MPHKWNHDKTAGQTYEPLNCNGITELDPSSNYEFCVKCKRPDGAHNGIPVNDHSKCIMTCEVCGEAWLCNKLYPDNRVCSGELKK